MTVPTPVTGTPITTTWGSTVASDVNGLLAQVDDLVDQNLNSRLTAVIASNSAQNPRITALETAVGTRNSQTFTAGDTIGPGDSVTFSTELFRSGISVGGSFRFWTVQTAGVYAISWQVQIGSAWSSELRIDNSVRSVAVVSGTSSYGQWTGFVAAGQEIVILAAGPGVATGPLSAGLNIFLVAPGG